MNRFRHDHLDEPDRVMPDFTDQIMHRLGFQRLNEAQAKRIRMRRWAGRGAVALIMLSAFGGALLWHANSDRARRPNEVTFDQAIDAAAREGEATRRAWVRTVDHARRLLPGADRTVIDPALSGDPIDSGTSADVDPFLAEPRDRSPVPWSGLL